MLIVGTASKKPHSSCSCWRRW